MRKIRINNEIYVRINVSRDGYSEDFTGKKVILFLQVGYKKIAITDFFIDGSNIAFRFPSKAQKYIGVYTK